MRLKTTVNVIGKASLECDCPAWWEHLGEDEKINYFLENCTYVVDMTELVILDDSGLSAQDLSCVELDK